MPAIHQMKTLKTSPSLRASLSFSAPVDRRVMLGACFYNG